MPGRLRSARPSKLFRSVRGKHRRWRPVPRWRPRATRCWPRRCARPPQTDQANAKGWPGFRRQKFAQQEAGCRQSGGGERGGLEKFPRVAWAVSCSVHDEAGRVSARPESDVAARVIHRNIFRWAPPSPCAGRQAMRSQITMAGGATHNSPTRAARLGCGASASARPGRLGGPVLVKEKTRGILRKDVEIVVETTGFFARGRDQI